MGTLLWFFPSATTSNSAGNMARAYIGTLRLNVSDNSAATTRLVLPFFQFMNSGNEGGIDAPSRDRGSRRCTAFRTRCPTTCSTRRT